MPEVTHLLNGLIYRLSFADIHRIFSCAARLVEAVVTSRTRGGNQQVVRFKHVDNGCNNPIDRARPRCDFEPFHSRIIVSSEAFLKLRAGLISAIYSDEETRHDTAVVRSFLKL